MRADRRRHPRSESDATRCEIQLCVRSTLRCGGTTAQNDMHSSRKRKQKEQATREEEQEASNGLNGGDGGAAHAREEHEDEEPQRQRRRRDAGSAAATSQQQHQHQQQQREGPSSTTGVAGTGLGGRTPIPPSDDEEEEDDDEQGGSGEGVDGDGGSEDPQQQPGGECSEDPAQQDGDGPAAKKKPHKKVLSEQKLRRLKEEYNRRGVVYISRCARWRERARSPHTVRPVAHRVAHTLDAHLRAQDPPAHEAHEAQADAERVRRDAARLLHARGPHRPAAAQAKGRQHGCVPSVCAHLLRCAWPALPPSHGMNGAP